MVIPDGAPPRTLIADDQPDILEALRLLLKKEGFQIESASSPAGILEKLRARDFDVLLMDLNYARDTTSGREGLDLLSHIRAIDDTLPVVAMTAWGSIDIAVEAMQRGVRDFVQKPWDNARLISVLRDQIERGQVQRKLARAAREEIDEARSVERALLPREIPRITGFSIATAWQPARDLAGDYFDVLPLNGSKVAFCIADAVGKGLPAALLMSNVQAAVRAYARDSVEPRELCERVNRAICGNTTPGRFITFFYCVLDVSSRILTYTNAGHCAPIMASSRGASRLDHGGAVLGVFGDWKYEQAAIQLQSGDRVLLFTDGVTDITDDAGEEFGEERLVNLALHQCGAGAVDLKDRIIQAAAEFSGGRAQDDATLVVLAAE